MVPKASTNSHTPHACHTPGASPDAPQPERTRGDLRLRRPRNRLQRTADAGSVVAPLDLVSPLFPSPMLCPSTGSYPSPRYWLAVCLHVTGLLPFVYYTAFRRTEAKSRRLSV